MNYQHATYQSDSGKNGDDPYQSPNQNAYVPPEEERDILEYLRSMGIFQKTSALIEPPRQQTEELKKKLQVLRMRIEQNFPFTDTTFPPQDRSISEERVNQKIEWKRLSLLIKQDQLRFLVQGKPIYFSKQSSVIEDKYILSALNIMLTNMKMIVRNFEITEINNAGIFGFWVNQGGQWDLMVLDDNFPTRNGEYCMAQTNNGIWLMVLEKALAKLYGSYSGLNGGFTNQILTDLTGAPTEIIEEGTAEEWKTHIQSWLTREFSIFVENDRDATSKNVLINSGYSFSVLQVEDTSTETIIKLKSPLNSLIYEGQWRNSSSKWTSSLRESLEVPVGPSTDGTFWMGLAEFRDSFQYLGNLRTHENYVYKWVNIDHVDKKQSIINFVMEEKSHMYITIHQQDERFFSKTSPNFEYPCTRIIVARINSSNIANTYEFIGSNYSSQREIFIDEIFLPGEYIITIEISWVQTNDRQFTINFYGESVPSQISETDTSNLIEIQKQIIQSMSIHQPSTTMKVRDYSQNGEPNIKVYNDIIAGMVFFYYQNKGTRKLRERVEMTELENLIICSPYEDSRTYEVNILPGKEIVVIYKYNPFGEKFSFNCKIKAALDQVETNNNQNSTINSQQQNMFNSQGMRNSKVLKFNNNMRNSKVHTLMNRQTDADEYEKNQFTPTDLIRVMRANSVPATRKWKDQEIGVSVYHYQHPLGAVIMIQNNGHLIYEEILTLSLQNMLIENSEQDWVPQKFEVDYQNSKVTTIIEPGNHQFIFLGVIKEQEPSAFKIESRYKCYSS